MLMAFACVFGGLLAGLALAWLYGRRQRLHEPETAPLTDERVQRLRERFNVAIEAAGFSAWEIDPRSRRFVWVENRLRSLDAAHLSLDEYGALLHRMMHRQMTRRGDEGNLR